MTLQQVVAGNVKIVETLADLIASQQSLIAGQAGIIALDIGRAIRRRLQASGKIGSDLTTIEATDGHGAAYSLQLAAGDELRLYRRTYGSFDGHAAQVGVNGSIVTVTGVTEDGLRLRTAQDKDCFVPWGNLRDPLTNRIRVSLGYAFTIDSAQGMTSEHHIAAFPRGTGAVDATKLYDAGTWDRAKSWLVTSKGEETRQVDLGRPLGVKTPIDAEASWGTWRATC